MAEYIAETRIHLDVDNDEDGKRQIAILLALYRIGVEEGQLKMSDLEIGLLRDNQPVDLPVEGLPPNDNEKEH